MKQWVPLFQIFLNSTSSEVDASHYFQQQHNPNTSSFLSLLLTPTPSPSSLPTHQNPPIFIQTLPLFVQSRILSFLTIECLHFCHRRLRSLAIHILSSDLPSSSDHPGFWVHRAAYDLLDAVSSSEPSPSFPPRNKDVFHTLPDWLQGSIATARPLLTWLPMPQSQLLRSTDFHSMVFNNEPEPEGMVIEEEEVDSCSLVASLDPQACDRAIALKAEVLASVSTSEAVRIADGIRQLCLDSGPNFELALLGLIKPWEGDDEIVSVLLSNLSGDGCSCKWPAHILCSTSLPKLLNLKTPASRVLLSATISLCKLHPADTVDALLFPLALRKKGINVVICDVLVRVIKESLHTSHVSAFCQKLLCGDRKDRRLVCLPCHQDLISDELVWTEPMFTLFQHILNHGVYLSPDTADQLVSVIVNVAEEYSGSLKFGNFFLCFVTKCTRAAKSCKVRLEKAAEKTCTFVTKSILLKLDNQ